MAISRTYSIFGGQLVGVVVAEAAEKGGILGGRQN
jgi:hypothetical protein